jgi:predicted acyltransferase
MVMLSGNDRARLKDRIASLDALRGLTVLAWLVAAVVPPILNQLPQSHAAQAVAAQFSPSFWHGTTVYDLVVPMFVFAAGVAIVPAFQRRKAAGQTNGEVAKRIVRRVVLLLAIGLVCEGGLVHYWPDLRFVGAFQRLAICYAVAGCLELTTSWRFQSGVLAFLLVDYGAILAFGASGEASPYSLEGNAAAAVDQMLLPGRKFFGSWDPEGILTTIPAVALAIAGLIVGKWLTGTLLLKPLRKLCVFCIGAAAMVAAFVGGRFVPVEPHLWTITFCVIVIGVGLALLSLFHAAIDLNRWNGAFRPFIVLGRNPLVVVLAIVGFLNAEELAMQSDVLGLGAMLKVAGPGYALMVVYVVVWVAFFLDARNVYLRP